MIPQKNCGLSAKTLESITKVLIRFPEVEKALFFGSRAMGNYKKGSDVDIAIQGKKINFDIINRIHSILEEETLLPYFFDVINYNEINNNNLKKHIDQEGIVFYKTVRCCNK